MAALASVYLHKLLCTVLLVVPPISHVSQSAKSTNEKFHMIILNQCFFYPP